MGPDPPQCCSKMCDFVSKTPKQLLMCRVVCCASLGCLHGLGIAGQRQRADGRPVAPGVIVVVPARCVRAIGYVQQRLASCVPHPPHPQRLVLHTVQCQSG
jgi:hypothetical protein